jgi:NAD+ kinase
LRAATLIRDWNSILGINAGRLGFGNRSKENIDEFLQVVIEKNIRFLKNIIELILRPANEALQDINFAMNEISVSRKDTLDDHH